MSTEPMFAAQEGDDDHPTPGPSSRWYGAAALLLVVGLATSLLIGRAAADQIDPQPTLTDDGTVQVLDARVSVFVAERAYDGGVQCTLSGGEAARVPLDYGVQAGEQDIDDETYVRVGQTPQGLPSGSYRLDCGDIDTDDVALTVSSGIGDAAGLLITSVLLGVGLTILALLMAILVAVLRARARRAAH